MGRFKTVCMRLRAAALHRPQAAGLACAALLVLATLLSQLVAPALDLALSAPAAPAYGWHRAAFSVCVGVALVQWASWVRLRCSDAVIARNLRISAGLLAAWVLLVLVKYETDAPVLRSLMWYLYYVPMLLVPSLALFCIMRAAAFDVRPAVRAARRAVLVTDVALAFLVLTNNLHHLVFSFSFADPGWDGNYMYVAGYWAVVAWTAAKLAAFFLFAWLAASRRLRQMSALAGAVVGVGLLYSALYALGVEAVRATNLSLAFSLVTLATFEVCLDVGLFPSVRDYAGAFRRLPLDLRVLGRDGREAFATEQAAPLPDSARAEAVRFASREGAASATFRLSDCAHRVFEAYRLPGGVALLTEDVSAIDARRRELEERREELRAYNELLAHSLAVQRRLRAQQVERALCDEVERSLAESFARMSGLLEALRADPPCGSAARRALLLELRVLLAYCKRKGALVLGEQEGRPYDASAVGLMTSEFAADLRAAGVSCACAVSLDAPVPACDASALFDCLHVLAQACVACSQASALVVVREGSGGAVEVRASLEAGTCGELDGDALAAALRAHAHEVQVQDGDGALSVRACVGRGCA